MHQKDEGASHDSPRLRLWVRISLSVLFLCLVYWVSISCQRRPHQAGTPPGASTNGFIVLYGGEDNDQKLGKARSIGNVRGRNQWDAMLSSSPGIIPVSDIVVIFNKAAATASCSFIVQEGIYQFILRYVAPGVDSDSFFYRLDSDVSLHQGLTNDDRQLIEYTLPVNGSQNTRLTTGNHNFHFVYREPVGMIDLTIHNVGGAVPDIIARFIDMISYPDRVYKA